MTFNLRFENDFDGENSWSHRRDFLVRTILKYGPQVVGTQEGKPSMFAFLNEHLHGYRMAAEWRHWDENCQYPTLYYREEDLTPLEGNEFWLSNTPKVHMSKSWDSAFPRMISCVLLETKQSKQQIWFAVTHLDHISEMARNQGAKMISTWAVDKVDPIVLMGDFNDVPGSEVHRILTGARGPLVDTWLALERKEGEWSYTQHGFTGVPDIGRIDWILVSPHFAVLDAAIVRDQVAGRYPSDHFPYWADLERE
jgi:endonuclease/exonuclease/phosphatase family metal-dependent hydrolase